jgi:hypothetical protein
VTERDDQWYDEAAGPLVRPYAMTSGRTRPANVKLDVATQVVVARSEFDPMGLGPEHQTILELCRRPYSVAEVASYVDVPLFVVKILLSDLIARGDITIRPPMQMAEPPAWDLLQAVLEGVRAL